MKQIRLRQIGLALLALACAVGAGAFRAPLGRQAREHELYIESTNMADVAVMQILPGGLRALAFNYVWLQSQEKHQAGRHYDARQLAELACKLMPSFPGVWSFHSWNMAWNISVTTHTREERWHWVDQGLRLLRDEGIPRNRKALLLYKELGWIFFFKMGRSLDEYHEYYKQQWASQMQHLLGSPGFGDTDEVIDAFRPVALAPLDKTPSRQGQWTIQPDQRAKLLADPAVRAYADQLDAFGIGINRSFLDAYNRFSQDEAVASVRTVPVDVEAFRDQEMSALINSAEHADARDKILAFLRAQILWNEYKMDPARMLQLMVEYDCPFDWRMVFPHGLYWIRQGFDIVQPDMAEDTTTLNTQRIAMFCMRTLIREGRLIYQEDPRDPEAPALTNLSDMRYVWPAHDEYVRAIEQLVADTADQGDDAQSIRDNVYREGHIAFLKDVIPMLYAADRRAEAAELYRYVKNTYDPIAPEWHTSVDEFVVRWLNQKGRLLPEVASSQVNAALTAALVSLARGDNARFRESYDYAYNKVYRVYQKRANEDKRFIPFEMFVAFLARGMLVRPQAFGVELTLEERSTLYEAVSGHLPANVVTEMYETIAPHLARQCAEEGVDVDRYFPPPPGVAGAGNQANPEAIQDKQQR